MSAEDFELRAEPATTAPGDAIASGDGPVIQETSWGYIIRGSDADHALRVIGSVAGRFAGAILLLAAAGLWLMPDALHGDDVFGVKIAAMVMFGVFGGYLLWAGRNALGPEYRIDKHHNEIRIGQRGADGSFNQTARVDFANVSSVFLLRAKDRPTRLFLRLADLDTGIEIASGSLGRMEHLKDRLADDLARPSRAPAPVTAPRRVRPRRVAA